MMKILVLIILLFFSGCGVKPVEHEELVLKNSQPIATFSTTEAQRAFARDRGLPVLLSGRATQYPPELDANKDGNGWVLLDIEVLVGGRVGDIKVLDHSSAVFEQAAIDAVRHWRFEPANESSRFIHRVTIIGTRGDHLQRDSVVTQ